MELVSYSDSEGSDEDQTQEPPKKDINTTTKPDDNFTVDKSNPRKIKVTLQERQEDAVTNGRHDGEPAPKRARIGGDFGGFNSMLPAPKRPTQSTAGSKTVAGVNGKKVFSLKTGAEPGFSRESDAELKESFAEQGSDLARNDLDVKDIQEQSAGRDAGREIPAVGQSVVPKQGHAIMFKPLSVARTTLKKKKPPPKMSSATPAIEIPKSYHIPSSDTLIAAPKLSLFSLGNADMRPEPSGTQQGAYQSMLYQTSAENTDLDEAADDTTDPKEGAISSVPDPNGPTESQSLDSIAADLNLSASAKRQLLGRNHRNAASKISSSIINFNTDQEYAANEVIRTSGEQVQHNPVRAIAPGKHSLKQLVSAASGQKEALEESFASGRRNKKEAGGRYGW